MSRVTPTTVHRLKVTLRHVKPPVWRRIEVRSTTKLSDFAAMLEGVVGWHGGHLHLFETRDRREFGVPDPDFDPDFDLGPPMEDEARHRVVDVLPTAGAKLRFDYDFGDGWEHDVVAEAIVPATSGIEYPRCIGGKRACPPEDCGGPSGYANLLEALADPGHERHADVTEWLGDEFDPDDFDAEEMTEAMRLPRLSGW
jgi:hypothetical protein